MGLEDGAPPSDETASLHDVAGAPFVGDSSTRFSLPASGEVVLGRSPAGEVRR